MGFVRPALPRRVAVVLVVVIWGAATAFGLAFAAWTSIGPVLLTVAPGNGVHVGDLVALIAAYTPAAVLTRWLLRREPPSAPAHRRQYRPGVRTQPELDGRTQIIPRVDVAPQPRPRPVQRYGPEGPMPGSGPGPEPRIERDARRGQQQRRPGAFGIGAERPYPAGGE